MTGERRDGEGIWKPTRHLPALRRLSFQPFERSEPTTLLRLVPNDPPLWGVAERGRGVKDAKTVWRDPCCRLGSCGEHGA